MQEVTTIEQSVYRATAKNAEALYDQASELRRAEALGAVPSPITEVLYQLDRRVFCSKHNQDGNPWIDCSKNSMDGIFLLCAAQDYPALISIEAVNLSENWLDDEFALDHPSRENTFTLDKRRQVNNQIPPVFGYFAVGSEEFKVIEALGDSLTIVREKSGSSDEVIRWS